MAYFAFLNNNLENHAATLYENFSAICRNSFVCLRKKNYSADNPLETVYTPSLFVSSQNKILYAIDPAHGSEKWEYKLNGNTVATPIVIGNYLFVATTDTLFKLDVNTGKLINKFTDPNLTGFASSPVTDGKVLYIAANSTAGAANVMAINPDNNSIMWTVNYSSSITPSLALFQDKLFVAQDNGTINCISKNNGSPIWVTPASIPLAPTTNLFSSPAVAYPYVYVGSTDNHLYALNINDGSNAWNYTAGNIINSSPIVYGGNVIFGCNDNYIYCVDSIAKDIRWKFKTLDRVISSAAAYRNIVFMGGYDSYVYALNILEGNLKWKYQATALFKASVLSVDGDIYAASFDKLVYKLDTAGNLKWKFNVNGPMESSPILYDYNNSKTYYPSITGMYQY